LENLTSPLTYKHYWLNNKRIHALTMGKTSQPTMILLHGALANAYWYQAIAEILSDQYYVIIPDLPGHGHSDWFEHYDYNLFYDFFNLISQNTTTQATICAHSLSAKLLSYMLESFENRFDHIIFLDPPPVAFNFNSIPKKLPYRFAKYYPDIESIKQRFRIIPSQPCVNLKLQEAIVNASITYEPDKGYRWQHDPNFWLNFSFIPDESMPKKNSRDLTLIYGEKTMVTSIEVRKSFQSIYPNLQSVSIPNAYHALMIDQPNQLTETIKQAINA
jgi:pimeloyl-ACP methyl ester carboxylesterase